MKIYKFIYTLIITTAIFCLTSCNNSSARLVKGNFADVEFFDNHNDLHEFLLDNMIIDVYACSDGLDDDDRMVLVVPASEEVKLELYRVRIDEYGNAEPNEEFMFGEGAPGQPIYFVSEYENNKSDVIVVAVNGIGQRAYWCPNLTEEGDLIIDEDFGNGYSIRGEENEEDGPYVQECKERYYIESECDVEEFGVKAVAKNGNVSIVIYDIDKFLRFNYSDEEKPTLENGTYYVENLADECIGIFVGDQGQNINPILNILLRDDTVQIMSISDAINHNDFKCSPVLTYCENIVGFVNDGGGAYEGENGETYYSYRTNYAIDKDGNRQEIELLD